MWRELTEADVLGVLNEPETEAYKTAAIRLGQDVLAEAFALVVPFCRGYIADNLENSLAAGLTLPERVIRPALHILRIDLLTRIDLEASDDRRSANTAAIRFFERVADGKVSIEQPTGATDNSSPGQRIKTLSKHERQATRQKLSGL